MNPMRVLQLCHNHPDLQPGGTEVLALPCDVSDAAAVRGFIGQVERHYGRIDVLVNNAGKIVVGPLEAMTLEDYQEMMGSNFYGAVHTVLAALPGMLRRGEGRILNISSVGGLVPGPHLGPYTASKYALNGFSEHSHRLVRADCMEWLSRTREQFDVILAAPPTFSDSKRLTTPFAVQRDHAELIRLALKRLAPGGVLFFSTPFKKFRLDNSLADDFDVADITRATIPRDFKRTPRIHACWEIRRRQEKQT